MRRRRNANKEANRNALTGRGALVTVVFLMVIVGAYGSGRQVSAAEDQENQLSGGQGSTTEEQHQENQLFATTPFELESGLAVVTMTHRGKGAFVVNLLSSRQEETTTAPGPIEFSGDQNGGGTTEVARALAKEAGPVAVSKAVNVPAAGKHLLDVKADGPWTVEVEQPRPSSAPKTTSFSGNNDTATPFFELSSGLKRITMTNLDEDNFGVSLLDKDGNAAKAAVLDKQKSQAGMSRTATSWTVDVGEDGLYLFNVRSDTLWTVEIADVDQPVSAGQTSSPEQGANAPTGLGAVPIFLINIAWALVLAAIIRFSGT